MEEGASEFAPVINLQNDLISLIKHLKFIDGKKPKFFWLGNRDQLCTFIKLVFGNANSENEEVSWAEDCSHNMCSFKLKSLTFKFCSTTTTLCIQGQTEQAAKEKLATLLSNTSESSPEFEVNDKSFDDSKVFEDIDQLEVCSDTSSVLSGERMKITMNEDDLVQEIITLKKGLNEVKYKVEFLMSKENMQISPNNDSPMVNEILALRNQVTDMSLKSDSLTMKIDEMEKEKQSLLTVIRVLHEDMLGKPCLVSGSDNNGRRCSEVNAKQIDDAQQNEEQFVKIKKNKNKKKKKASTISEVIPDKTHNKGQHDNQRNKKPANNEATLILGDSIIKRLSSWKLSKATSSKITVCSFPGARVQDMYHYVKPSLAKADQLVKVVLHVGTNDIQHSSPQAAADEIVDLARHIENNRPQSTVCISELIQRSDSSELSKKVGEVNKLLGRYCKQSGRTLTKHNNIDESCLNQGKLHLNNKGVAIIASNLASYITNKSN